MRETNRWLVGGTLLFLAGAGVALVAFDRASAGLAWTSLIGIGGAALCFGMAAWRASRRVDWTRVGAEQRLWESGPLGRAWLRIRKALPGL